MAKDKNELRELRLKEERLLYSKAPRALIAICIDNSMSMSGSRMNIVNQEIYKFLKNMNEDKMARDSVEVCIVTFGHEIKVAQEFLPIAETVVRQKNIIADGSRTEMGGGVAKALELLDDEIADLEMSSIRMYKPWLIIISDGEATDRSKCVKVSQEVINRQKEGRLKVKCMSFSTEDETNSLKQFSIEESVDMVDSIKTMEFFSMLSRSISAVSQGRILVGEF